MQNIGKLTIVILTILVTLAEPLVKGTTRAAPQGRELYEEHEVEKRALLDKEKSSQTITEAEKPKTIVIYSSHGRTDLEIEVGEATDEPPQLAIVDPDQNQHQPKDRNLKTRQTQEEVNQDEIDLNDDGRSCCLLLALNFYTRQTDGRT